MAPALRRSDALLPLALGAIATAEVMGYDGAGRWSALAIELAACALLVARRTRTVLTVSAAALVVMSNWLVGPALDDLATPILVLGAAAYALARWIPDLRGLIGMAVILGATLASYMFVDERTHDVTDVVFVLAFFVPPYVFGRIVRRLADYNELLRREQELVRRQAARDERDRIARELHDVIAHSLSAMVVQVAAAEELVARDPARAREVLARVAATGRGAIVETGRLLHVLRDSDDELGLAPTPGLRDLDRLVDEFERDGLRVELVVEGPTTDLPAAVDVSAYRILREALTNALRYSTDGSVRVELSVTPSGVTLHAVNPTEGRTGLGTGLGLAGLEERVAVLGGTLRAASHDGRYELVATLPTAPVTV